MSSLRLALKQSLQETSAQGASSSSDENEFNGGEDDIATSSSTTTTTTSSTAKQPPPQQHSSRQENDDWKVAAPSETLIQRAAALGIAARDHVTLGLRVKVQFDHKYWYGGRISALSKDASKIQIHYDDGSTEISKFPNGVIIDATNNGAHDESVRLQAKFFETGGETNPSPVPLRSAPTPPHPAPTTPKPERKLQLSKTMAANDHHHHAAAPPTSAEFMSLQKLTIATPGMEFNTTSTTERTKGNGTPRAPPPTPTTPGSPDNGINKPKRKRGRPRKHPLPLDANDEVVLPPRSPNVPKKKTTAVPPISSSYSSTSTTAPAVVATTAGTTTPAVAAAEPKKLSIRIPVPDKIKQSLQTPKDNMLPLMEQHAVILATKKPSPKSPKERNNNNNITKKIKQKRSSEEEDDSAPRGGGGGRKKKRPGPDQDDVKWVRCDACFKWRIIPKSAIVSEEEKWFCANNIYDPKRASCDAPQQAVKQKKKRQRMLGGEEVVATTAAVAAAAATQVPVPQENLIGSQTPHSTAREEVAVTAIKQRRSSLPLLDNELVAVVDDAKAKRTGKRPRTTTTSTNTSTTTDLDEEPIVAKRGRGRPRRNKETIKTTTTTATTTTTTTATLTTDVSETENLEWVQCETCGKWRKIAPHISATDLPEVWTCEMNDWNPASASCDAPEDKAEGLQDIRVDPDDGNNSNKLTYRHLIFGPGTGRRVNRPISERARAAESIFSVQFDEEDAPTKVLYSDSNAYVCRGRPNLSHLHHSDNDGNRVSVLQLMSKSNLWKELHATSKSISSVGALSRKNPPNLAVYSYENLPRDIQQPMKDLVLLLLSYESFSVHEIIQKSRSTSPLDLPENCRKAVIACTENVIYTTLYQLMKEGKVESVYKQEENGSHTTRCYRRVLSNRAEFRRSSSRCLKIAKPWKQRAPLV